jgi:hypothetical protein
VGQVAKQKVVDLEAVEGALRCAVLAAGARILERLIEGVGRGRRPQPLICVCGARMVSKGLDQKELVTILGELRYRRSRYECPVCKRVVYPGDEQLDVVGTSRSPGLRRMMARAGSRESFKEAREDLRIYAGIELSAKDVERVAEHIGEQMERWQAEGRQRLLQSEDPAVSQEVIPVMYIEMDGTGVPMVKGELTGRRGKQPDGTARTREAKLGCVFTQIERNPKGRPIREDGSTSFVGAIETAEQFGERIEAEAIRRGLPFAQKVVVLGDGAVWIRGITEHRFSQATQIIDLYHAREHVDTLCKLSFAPEEKKVLYHRIRWWTDLDEGNVEKIVEEATDLLPQESQTKSKAEGEIRYLDENKERMRYADFRKRGLFVGSGVVEAGCKTIIGARLKQSGMEWSVRGANSIIALRCVMLSDRLEDFWEARAQ